MALNLQLWNLVCDFLLPKEAAFLKLTCAAAGLSDLPLAKQLLLWTKETVALRAANARIVILERRLEAALHRVEMRRLREIETTGAPDYDDESIMCNVCGRIGGGQGMAFFLEGGGVMCDVCYDEDDSPPAIHSSF